MYPSCGQQQGMELLIISAFIAAVGSNYTVGMDNAYR
jgi:hypothetical protein